jgi:hypothetical protein
MLVITAPLAPTATNVPTPLTVPYVTDCQELPASGDPNVGVVLVAQDVPSVLVIT